MTSYPRSAYGQSNPNSGRPPNGDRAAWGGHAWPAGVPARLLGTVTYRSSFGQNITIQVRAELVELWTLAQQLMDRVHRYQVWSSRAGENWGPWGYANRPVAGSNTPSGHSMALSVDMNAPDNPYSATWRCDMPPAMVADLEALGLFWGGRYTGKFDPMHYGYCWPPSSVAGHVALARRLLAAGGTHPPTGGGSGGGNTPDPTDWLTMATQAEVQAAVAAAIKAATPDIVTAVWAAKMPNHAAWQDNQVVATTGRPARDTLAGAENNSAQLRKAAAK